MKKKTKFLKAVQILAPGDEFILNAARRVPADNLPSFPGGAALEMVVALQKLQPHVSRPEPECDKSKPAGQLSMSHALRIQSARYWLELGEIDQAVLELGALSSNACDHPSAIKARVAVRQAIRERLEVTVQE